jgi:hypothetical protein
MKIYESRELLETPTGRTRVRFDITSGFFLVTQAKSSSVQSVLSIDPDSIDALVAMWPEWRKSLPDVHVSNADKAMASRPISRASPEQPRPPSSPQRPSMTGPGSGAPSGGTAKAPPAGSLL